MPFTYTECPIKGLIEIQPKVFGDHRGYFLESWSKRDFVQAGIDVEFVQDNQSMSCAGVLRGLHFQKNHPQGKLVRVIEGEVFDVAVDIRDGSSTWGCWHGVLLSAEKQNQFWIPEGFAHGFLVLSPKAVFAYKCTDFYYPEHEAGLLWNDPGIGIKWPEITSAIQLSDKDTKWPVIDTLKKRKFRIMIWLIGNKGMLGTELSVLFDSLSIEYTGTDRETDITDRSALENFCDGKNITLVINCAAYTAVDKAEDDQEACMRLNASAPAIIGSVAKDLNAQVIHISTDYVFDGTSQHPYKPDDPASPSGMYGLSKHRGETALLQVCPEAYVIRTAWLYGRYGRNFVYTMLKLMKERDSLKVVNDQHGTPTWTYDLSNAILRIAHLIDAGKPPAFGVYHYTNKGDTTWYEFARQIYASASALQIPLRPCLINPCATSEYPTKARRPAWSVLDKSKTEQNLGIEIPEWKTSLECFLSSVKTDLTGILETFR